MDFIVKSFFRNCGFDNPSWVMIAQFVKFLYVQLSDCHYSIFCNGVYLGVEPQFVVPFKRIIVYFMIQMSKVSGFIVC